MKQSQTEVRVGQRYRDRDKRSAGRTVEVVGVVSKTQTGRDPKTYWQARRVLMTGHLAGLMTVVRDDQLRSHRWALLA